MRVICHAGFYLIEMSNTTQRHMEIIMVVINELLTQQCPPLQSRYSPLNGPAHGKQHPTVYEWIFMLNDGEMI